MIVSSCTYTMQEKDLEQRIIGLEKENAQLKQVSNDPIVVQL